MNWVTNIRLFLHLKPAEFLMAQVVVALVLFDCILLIHKDSTLDALGYSQVVFVAAFLLSIGYFYRLTGRSERIGYAMIGTGIFMLFMMCLGLFNYLLLPLQGETIDKYIVQIDAMFGYHWPDVMALAAQYPTITYILKLAYSSTTIQLAILTVLLGLSGRIHDLHMMLLLITITAVITVCFWGFFPSFGTTYVHTLPDEIWESVNPFVGKEYGVLLAELSIKGASYVTPSEIRGLIAFPSYHAVLAIIAAYAARNVKIVGPIFFILNLLVLPSVFIHGGHHLMDLFASITVFAFALWAAKRTLEVYKTAPNPAVAFA